MANIKHTKTVCDQDSPYRSRPIPSSHVFQLWWSNRIKKENLIRSKWINDLRSKSVSKPGFRNLEFEGKLGDETVGEMEKMPDQLHIEPKRFDYWHKDPPHASHQREIRHPSTLNDCQVSPDNMARQYPSEEQHDLTMMAHHPKYGVPLPRPASTGKCYCDVNHIIGPYGDYACGSACGGVVFHKNGCSKKYFDCDWKCPMRFAAGDCGKGFCVPNATVINFGTMKL